MYNILYNSEKNLEAYIMSDMKEVFSDMREHSRRRRKRNIEVANPAGWMLHTQWHWSRTLDGHRLDYWPSKNKWKYKSKIQQGDIIGFIKHRDPDFVIPPKIDAKTNEEIWNDMGYKKSDASTPAKELKKGQQLMHRDDHLIANKELEKKEWEKQHLQNPTPEPPEQSLATAPINVYSGKVPPWEDD